MVWGEYWGFLTHCVDIAFARHESNWAKNKSGMVYSHTRSCNYQNQVSVDSYRGSMTMSLQSSSDHLWYRSYVILVQFTGIKGIILNNGYSLYDVPSLCLYACVCVFWILLCLTLEMQSIRGKEIDVFKIINGLVDIKVLFNGWKNIQPLMF